MKHLCATFGTVVSSVGFFVEARTQICFWRILSFSGGPLVITTVDNSSLKK